MKNGDEEVIASWLLQAGPLAPMASSFLGAKIFPPPILSVSAMFAVHFDQNHHFRCGTVNRQTFTTADRQTSSNHIPLHFNYALLHKHYIARRSRHRKATRHPLLAGSK